MPSNQESPSVAVERALAMLEAVAQEPEGLSNAFGELYSSHSRKAGLPEPRSGYGKVSGRAEDFEPGPRSLEWNRRARSGAPHHASPDGKDNSHLPSRD